MGKIILEKAYIRKVRVKKPGERRGQSGRDVVVMWRMIRKDDAEEGEAREDGSRSDVDSREDDEMIRDGATFAIASLPP